MGSSKKVTVSYWYKLIMHLGWCKGPIDALLEIRGGDRVAWRGRQTSNGDITINKPDLYGGESAEGGIQGTFEVRMGEPDQMPSSYMASEFGEAQPGYRGRATILLKGPKIGAGNPYPKPLYFKLERIFKGWDNDVVWYPETAAVPLQDGQVELLGSGWEYQVENFSEPNTVWDNFNIPSSGWQQGGELPYSTGDAEWPAMRSNIWIRRQLRVNAVGAEVRLAADNGCVLFVDGVQVGVSNPTNENIPSNNNYPVVYQFGAVGVVTVVGKAYAEINAGNDAGNLIDVTFGSLGGTSAMNPAHILYDSITSRRENGGMEEPVARINDASFRAAADKLYAEGFGLCCTWYGGESAEQFQQRICNVIGGSITQSRLDGQYYLDLLRDVANPDLLPTITDDDILEWEDEPAIPSESINQIQVKWFDPTTREERITTPVQALGAIEDAGGLLADVREYYEIPVESLALRVAQRDLQSVATALRKFTFSCTRKAFDLRPGMQIRLLCPKRGFADVIVVIGDIDYGDFGNDEINIVALQDVFSLPDSAFVDPQVGLGPATSAEPVNIVDQVAIETPYVELASAMSTADLDALDVDTSFLMVGARRPANGVNYRLATRAVGEEYEEYGSGDWTPTAVIVEGDTLLEAEPATEFTLSSGRMLDQVAVGTWALWGDEMCRVDALDATLLTITLGRAVGDTVPANHAPGEMIYFIGDWYATDSREYAEGETVNAKLMNRTAQGQVAIAVATELTVDMEGRQSRPYPPGQFKINGEYYPASATGPTPLEVTWVGRNRQVQADQLIESTAGEIAAPVGTTYTLRGYENDILSHTEEGIAGNLATWAPSQTATIRVELESVNALGRASYQFHSHEMAWTASLPDDIMAANILSKMEHWWPMDESSGPYFRDMHGGADLKWFASGSGTTLSRPTIRSGGAAATGFTGSGGGFLGGHPEWTLKTVDFGAVAWLRLAEATYASNRPLVCDNPATDVSEAANQRMQWWAGSTGTVVPNRMGAFWEYGPGTNYTAPAGNTDHDTAAHMVGISRNAVNVTYWRDALPDGGGAYTTAPTGGDYLNGKWSLANVPANSATSESSDGPGLRGDLQDVSLYRTPLNSDEMLWLYNGGVGRSYDDIWTLSELTRYWTPAQLRNKVVWMKADHQDNGESTAGYVNRIANLTGFDSGLPYSNSVTNQFRNNISTLNGRKVLTGNGTTNANGHFVFPNTRIRWNAVAGSTIVYVGRAINPTGGSTLQVLQAREGSNGHLHSIYRNDSTGSQVVTNGGRRLSADSYGSSSQALVATDWNIIGGFNNYTAGTSSTKLNGNAAVASGVIYTTGVTSATVKGDLGLGGQPYGTAERSLNSEFAEVLVIDGLLTSDEWEKLEGYLAHQWGLTAGLPGGHPYKSSPPTV